MTATVLILVQDGPCTVAKATGSLQASLRLSESALEAEAIQTARRAIQQIHKSTQPEEPTT